MHCGVIFVRTEWVWHTNFSEQRGGVIQIVILVQALYLTYHVSVFSSWLRCGKYVLLSVARRVSVNSYNNAHSWYRQYRLGHCSLVHCIG